MIDRSHAELNLFLSLDTKLYVAHMVRNPDRILSAEYILLRSSNAATSRNIVLFPELANDQFPIPIFVWDDI